MKLTRMIMSTRTKKVDSDIHQASTLAFDWRSSSPSEGVGEGTPRPRKSRLVRAMMPPETRKGKKVMTGVSVLGRMCLVTMVQLLTPMARAART